MNHVLRLVGGAVLGAGTMFVLDPHRGRSRRAYLRDKAWHLLRKASHDARVASADFQHRAKGLIVETKTKLTHPQVPDDILVERIRSKIGRVVSFPRSLEIKATDGQVTLLGQVLQNEMEPLFLEVHQIPGVRGVKNELQKFDESSHNPALQSRKRSHREPKSLTSPAVRFLISGIAGGALTFYAYARRKTAA
jgi:hypothetical protein